MHFARLASLPDEKPAVMQLTVFALSEPSSPSAGLTFVESARRARGGAGPPGQSGGLRAEPFSVLEAVAKGDPDGEAYWRRMYAEHHPDPRASHGATPAHAYAPSRPTSVVRALCRW